VTERANPIDQALYRQVLGHFPTGVTVVTAAADDGPVGLAIGSFSSVSLDPALVAFFPAKSSSSWPGIEAAGAFCVNVLAEDQEDVCRRFATKGVDKFEGLGYKPAGSGAPLLDGVLAWIDCDLHEVIDAGDHWCVLGQVRELEVAREAGPLVFFRGGYGRFAV
jgi:3-hydroxy-9,10-secoandrosta-1,3,5(10)-triene-9,17-dione monooxygenase reductase component